MKVALYARVSTKVQAKQQTIASQVAALREFARSRGDTVTEDCVFLDEGVSGAILARRGLDRLRDAAQAGQFDAVMIHSPDRLSRKYAYLILILEEFERLGVPIVFLEQPPGDDPHTILLTQIQAAVAEYERAKLAERYRRGKLHRASQGEVFWTHVPFGYRRVPRRDGTPAHLVIDSDQAATVRSIFEWHTDGMMSIRQIAKRLTRSGVATAQGKNVWGETSVHKILHNEAYIGTVYYNRSQTVALSPGEMVHSRIRSGMKTTRRPREDWIAVSIPPVIEQCTFERSQARHEANSQFSPRRLKEEHWLLRRLLRCGRCGYKYACVGATRRSGQFQHYYYRCGRLSDTARRGRCSRTYVQAAPLDEMVWTEIRKHLLNPELLLKAHQELGTNGVVDEESLERQLGGAQQRLRQAQGERARLVDAYQAGYLEKKEFEARVRKVRARIEGIDTDLRRLQEEHRKAHGGNTLLQRIEGFACTVTEKLDTMSFHERQALVRMLLDEVVLDGHDVYLQFKIPLPRSEPKACGPDDVSARRPVSNRFDLRSQADQEMDVRVSIKERAKSLDGRDGSRLAVRLSAGCAEGLADRQVGSAGEPDEALPPREEERPETFGHREHDLPMRDRLENLLGQKPREDNLPLLRAAWTYPATLAGKSEKVLILAGRTCDPCETKF